MKSKNQVGILATSSYLPERVVDNNYLEKIVDTTDEWIIQRTGIKQRRRVAPGEAASDMAAQAARKVLDKAKLSAQDVELLIVATITPDKSFPATACYVQDKIGARNAVAFDISAACSGYIYALSVAQGMIEFGEHKNALVIGTEVLTSITDWFDRGSCILFGDGAGAALLASSKGANILSSHLATDGSLTELLHLPAGGSRRPADYDTLNDRQHFIKMKGNELFKVAVIKMTEAAQIALSKCKLTSKDIDLLIPHQANVRILKAVAKRLGIPEETVFMNVDRYGNMSSASSAVALDEAVSGGHIKKGDIIVLDAFGAGLTWGAMVVKW